MAISIPNPDGKFTSASHNAPLSMSEWHSGKSLQFVFNSGVHGQKSLRTGI